MYIDVKIGELYWRRAERWAAQIRGMVKLFHHHSKHNGTCSGQHTLGSTI